MYLKFSYIDYNIIEIQATKKRQKILLKNFLQVLLQNPVSLDTSGFEGDKNFLKNNDKSIDKGNYAWYN